MLFSLGIQPRTMPWNHCVKPVRMARPSCNEGLWNAIPVLPLSPQKPDTEQRGGGSGILGALWAPPFLWESACGMQQSGVRATYTTRVGCVAVSTRMTLHTQQVPLSAQHPKGSAFSWQCFQQCIVVACNFCRRQQCECLVALAAGAVAKSCDSCLKRAGWLWIRWLEKDRVVFKFLGFIFSNHIFWKVSRWFCSCTGSWQLLQALLYLPFMNTVRSQIERLSLTSAPFCSPFYSPFSLGSVPALLAISPR